MWVIMKIWDDGPGVMKVSDNGTGDYVTLT